MEESEFFLNASDVEKSLSYSFKDKDLLLLALTHRSFWNEHQNGVKGYNERLEFLGDSVLSLIVSEYLFSSHPTLDEGVLSDFRSQLVSAPSCVSFVEKLGIQERLLLGKGEQRKGYGKGLKTILADFFEAIVGAIYQDGGYEAAKSFFLTHFKDDIEKRLAHPERNWKAELQDFAQKTTHAPPRYVVKEESGPAHMRLFKIEVYIQDEKMGEGEGSSKKEAEVVAARQALLKMESINEQG